MLIEQPKRASRVRFKHPVRIETLSEPKRVIRTLTANVSRDGLFVRMPEPLPPGTRLHVALEAAGAPHALAEGEVCWGTREGDFAGCGVRFTKYAHPRAKELLTHLVESIEHNRPLRVASRPARWRRRLLLGALPVVLIAAIAFFAIGSNEAPAPSMVVESQSVIVAATPEPAEPVAVATPEVVAPVAPVAAPAKPEVVAPKQKPVLTSMRPAKKAEPSPALQAALKGAPAPVPAQRSGFGTSMSIAGTTRGSLKLTEGAATKLSWEVSSSSVRLSVEGKVTKAFFLASPPRAVFDVEGAQPAHAQTLDVAAPHGRSLRVGQLANGTRLVLDLERAPKNVKQDGASLVLSF